MTISVQPVPNLPLVNWQRLSVLFPAALYSSLRRAGRERGLPLTACSCLFFLRTQIGGRVGLSEADSQMVATRWSLAGRTALVTGATLGIGLAVAEEFLSFGARVVAVARDAARLEARVEGWRRSGSEAEGVAADLSTFEGRETVLRRLREFGRLDALVNNVGTNVRKPAIQYAAEEYEHVITTNLTSAFELTRAAHPLLKASG